MPLFKSRHTSGHVKNNGFTVPHINVSLKQYVLSCEVEIEIN